MNTPSRPTEEEEESTHSNAGDESPRRRSTTHAHAQSFLRSHKPPTDFSHQIIHEIAALRQQLRKFRSRLERREVQGRKLGHHAAQRLFRAAQRIRVCVHIPDHVDDARRQPCVRTHRTNRAQRHHEALQGQTLQSSDVLVAGQGVHGSVGQQRLSILMVLGGKAR